MSVGLSIQDLLTPVAVIDEAVMENNIKVAQEYFDRIGRKFRPHIKTHKIPALAALQLRRYGSISTRSGRRCWQGRANIRKHRPCVRPS